MNSTDEPDGQGLRILGQPLSLWAIGTVGLLVLTALLGYFMWRLAQDPLEMEMPPHATVPAAELR